MGGTRAFALSRCIVCASIQEADANGGSCVKTMDSDSVAVPEKEAYEAPRLNKLGHFHIETQQVCILDKTWGGYDGWGHIPISNCS